MVLAAASNTRVILKRYVMTVLPTEYDMEVVTAKAPALPVSAGSSAVVVKNLYISCDPYMRNQMIRHEAPSYVAPDFVPGEVLTGCGVMKVISSGHPDFKAGDLVWGVTGWEEYTLINNPESLSKINHPELPLSYCTGVLGMPGLTAYAGSFEVSNPKKGKYVFVSAACGAVGQIVGQLAKITCFPEGIDIYFENVGGATLDRRVVQHEAGRTDHGVWMILQYNLEWPDRVRNLFYIITNRLRIEGFLSFDYNGRYRQLEEEMAEYLREGKVVYMEDVTNGLDVALAALVGLFTGRNIGKQLVSVARG